LKIPSKQRIRQRFTDLPEAYRNLKLAEDIVDGQLQRRQKVFDDVNEVWGKTMLPKGMSTDSKKYFFRTGPDAAFC
jgi:hexosaminidase